MVNRYVTGAHYGLRDWLVQRLTAVLMLMAVVGGIGYWVLFPVVSSSVLHALPVRILATLSLLALLWHAWIGVRDIWMDYVKPAGLRLALHTFSVVWLLGCLIYMIAVVWGVQ